MTYISNRRLLPKVSRALKAIKVLDDLRYDNPRLADYGEAATAISNARWALAQLEGHLQELIADEDRGRPLVETFR